MLSCNATVSQGVVCMLFRKILVPLDDSEHSKHAFLYALGLAQSQDAHVALLHCNERLPMLVGGEAREELQQERLRESERLLIPYAKTLREIGSEPALVIKTGAPVEAIVEEAASGGYDLVVMGSRGLSDLEGVMLGSVAHGVLAEAVCPVLVTR